MDSFKPEDYEKYNGSPRKQAKCSASEWKAQRKANYSKYAYFKYAMRKDFKSCNAFLKEYLVKAWPMRHIDHQVRDDIREALHLTIYLKHLSQHLK